MKVSIIDLYPYEDSGVAAKIKRQKKKLQNNTAEPISLLRIGEDLLVVDGNDTAFAAKQLGQMQVEAKEISKPEQEMRPYRDGLANAKKKNLKGYENWPVDHELTNRGRRYE